MKSAEVMEYGPVAATALLCPGTWYSRGSHRWAHAGSAFSKLLASVSPAGRVVPRPHPAFWSYAEDGLIAEHVWHRLTGRTDFKAWREGGSNLAPAILEESKRDTDVPLVVVSHSHGGQVAAYAFDELRTLDGWFTEDPHERLRPVVWLAVDPPVRRELHLIYNAAHQSLMLHCPSVRGPYVVQTRSSGLDPRSWPRWCGGRKPPWNASVLSGSVEVVPQPGGHSRVLYHAEDYAPWWRDTFSRFDGLEGGKL